MRMPFKVLLLAALAGAAVLAWQRFSITEPVAVRLAAVERGRVEATVANTRAGTVKACRRSKLSPALEFVSSSLMSRSFHFLGSPLGAG